jgi:hypothetical protein
MVRLGGADSLTVESVSSNSRTVSARHDAGRGELLLHVTAPETAGRFDAVVTLRYNDGQTPDFSVRVAGLVRSESVRSGSPGDSSRRID